MVGYMQSRDGLNCSLLNFKILTIRQTCFCVAGSPLWLPFVTDSIHYFMDRISQSSRVGKWVRFSGLRIPSLLFADYIVNLASSVTEVRLSLGQFAAKSEVAAHLTPKPCSKAWKRVDCTPRRRAVMEQKVNGAQDGLSQCQYCRG